MPARCALGCPPSDVSLHTFPHPNRYPETFRAWVNVIGGKVETPDDIKYYRKKIICARHFTNRDKNRNNRLNCLAVPSLYLPIEPEDVHEEVGTETNSNLINLKDAEPLLSQEIIVTSTGDTLHTAENDFEGMATSPTSPSITADYNYEEARVPRLGQIPRRENGIHQALEQCFCSAHEMTTSTTSTSIKTYIRSRKPSEHNYFKKDSDNQTIHAPRKMEDLPLSVSEKYMMHRQIKNLKTQLRRLKTKLQRSRQQAADFKTRLANAKKINNTSAFQRVTKNMTAEAKLFTKMQFSQTKKLPSGRRFGMEEKILAISLYKKSPKCYTLLSRFFTLPSTKTLKKHLAEIKKNRGSNNDIPPTMSLGSNDDSI